MVEQALERGASIARVAGAQGLNANVVFHWRRLYNEGRLSVEPIEARELLPVSIAERAVDGRQSGDATTPICGSIHIELPGAIRIGVEGGPRSKQL